MSEEFLREHDLDENVMPTTEQSLFLGLEKDHMKRFEEFLERRLVHTANETEMVQAVVMAALEAEGLEMKRSEVIIEAAMVNPEIREEAIRFAESIMKKNIQ